MLGAYRQADTTLDAADLSSGSVVGQWHDVGGRPVQRLCQDRLGVGTKRTPTPVVVEPTYSTRPDHAHTLDVYGASGADRNPRAERVRSGCPIRMEPVAGVGGERRQPLGRHKLRQLPFVSIGVLPFPRQPRRGCRSIRRPPLTLVMGGGPSGATIAALPDTAPELEDETSAIKGRLPLTDVVAIDYRGSQRGPCRRLP